MNVADSELMAQVLGEHYDLTSRAEDADLYLINTCAIRRKSEEKVRSLLGSLRPLKRARPELILGVGGCVAQQEGERLLAFAPHLNLVFGTKGIYRLPELVDRAARGERVVDVALGRECPELPHRTFSPGTVQTMVTIMRGCDNFCSFCVVPYVRGREASREPGAIVDEVTAFLDAGGLEVTLLGQNVNSYGRGLPEPMTFPRLLRRLNAPARPNAAAVRHLSPPGPVAGADRVLRRAARPVRTSPSAGAIRRQPGPGEDESGLHPGTLPGKGRRAQAGLPRHRPVHRSDRGLSRGNRGGLPPNP